jgi:hypothetical protein
MDGTIWKDHALLEDTLVVNGELFPIQLPTEGAEESESEDDSDEDAVDDDVSDDGFGGGLQDEDFNSKDKSQIQLNHKAKPTLCIEAKHRHLKLAFPHSFQH